MDKVWFHVKTDNIEVPEEELFSVIDTAIKKGKKSKKHKKKSKMTVSMASMTVALILISGFVFAPMTKVLAGVPYIGSIYESLHMDMGKELEDKKLVTELNQTISDNGIDITITSVYYDGIYIGITFKAEGEGLNNNLDNDYSFYHYIDNGVKIGWSGSNGDLIKVDNYYESAIQVQYPDEQLPKEFTIPITFENMGGVEGDWQFDIPVSQLPMIAVHVENSTTKDENYYFTLDSIVIGESNMRLDYITTIPTEYLNFKIIDDKGNELSNNSLFSWGSEFAVFETGIEANTKYLLIYPVYRQDRKYTVLEPLRVNVQDN
ncbi:DUF4179 domain-containing protein [Bacillaceae bacterium W0354]